MTHPAQRFVLFATGLVLAAIGLNTALGGMATLGWQFPPEAVGATAAPPDFARHDSNARFFGGVFVALALVMAAAAVALDRLRPVVIALLLAMAAGGVARLLQPGYSALGDMALAPSLLAELVLAPALALWLWRTRGA